MADDRPIDDLEFDQLMAGVGLGHEGPRLAVAVSGGPDSLALAFLARRWVERRSGVLVGLTVDHGLRPEATAEAAFVKSLFGGWGLDHETLIWRPSGIGGAGQAAARKARYDLLLEACQRWTIFQLVIGHNQGDQGETLLQRLERQSGAVGLPAMRQAALRADVRLLRPLLSLPKPRLMATCAKAGIEPVNDPSNVDDRFDRPALRGMLNHQNPSRQARRHDALYSAAGRASEVASRLERRASEIQLACTLVRPHGYVWLDPVCLARTTPLVAERVLARIIGAVGGGDFLRGATLSDLVDDLRAEPACFTGRTAGGVYFRSARNPKGEPAILACREPANLPKQVVSDPGPGLWDGRFLIDPSAFHSQHSVIAPIGKANASTLREVWACPTDVATTLPAVWQKGEIVALPQFSSVDRIDLTSNVARLPCSWRPGRTLTAVMALGPAPPVSGNV